MRVKSVAWIKKARVFDVSKTFLGNHFGEVRSSCRATITPNLETLSFKPSRLLWTQWKKSSLSPQNNLLPTSFRVLQSPEQLPKQTQPIRNFSLPRMQQWGTTHHKSPFPLPIPSYGVRHPGPVVETWPGRTLCLVPPLLSLSPTSSTIPSGATSGGTYPLKPCP